VEGKAGTAADLGNQHNRNRETISTASELHPFGKSVGGLDGFRPVWSDNSDATGMVGGFSEHGQDFLEVAR